MMKNKENVSGGEMLSLMIQFVIGSSLFMGTAATAAGNNNWMANSLAILFAIPLMLIYARLNKLFPGKNLFDILNGALGPVIGRLIACFYIFYALHLGALVLRNFGEFTKTVALTQTPMLAMMICVTLLAIWACYAGIEVIARSAKFLIGVVFFILILTLLLSLRKSQYHYLKPLIGQNIGQVWPGAFGTLSFPFAEAVLFIGLFNFLKPPTKAKSFLLRGTLIAGVTIVVITVRNLLILGPGLLNSVYFPSYVAVSRISVGLFLERFEGSVAIVFVTALFFKVSVCLFVASQGLSSLLKLKDYRSVVVQLGLIMGYLSVYAVPNTMEMERFAVDIYKYYAFPVQIAFPVLVWIVGEIRTRLNKGKTQLKA